MKTGFEGLNESAKKNKTWAPNSWWIWKFLADMLITFLELLFRCLDLDPNNAKMLYFQVKNKKRTPSEVQQIFFEDALSTFYILMFFCWPPSSRIASCVRTVWHVMFHSGLAGQALLLGCYPHLSWVLCQLVSWPLSRSFSLLCLVKGVFSPVPPDREYFVPSQSFIIVLFTLFHRSIQFQFKNCFIS